MDRILLTLAIFVPVRHHKWLGGCLDSLSCAKIEKDTEILICGDESYIRSVISGAGNRYPGSIRVLDGRGYEFGEALVTAVNEAKGKYFKILEAPDRINDTAFMVYTRRLRELEADLILNQFTKENKETGERFAINYFKIYFNRVYDLPDDGIENLSGYFLFLPAITYRTDLLRSKEVSFGTGDYTVQEYLILPLAQLRNLAFINAPVCSSMIETAVLPGNVRKDFAGRLTVCRNLTDHYSRYYAGKVNGLTREIRFHISTFIGFTISLTLTVNCRSDRKYIWEKMEQFAETLINTDLELYDSTRVQIEKIKKKKFNRWRRIFLCSGNKEIPQMVVFSKR